MTTRAAAAREAAFIASSLTPNGRGNPSLLSSSADTITEPMATMGSRKRKRSGCIKEGTEHVNGELITGGWDELPHNMGQVTTNVPARKPEENAPSAGYNASKHRRPEKRIKTEDVSPDGEGISGKVQGTRRSRLSRSIEQQPTSDSSDYLGGNAAKSDKTVGASSNKSRKTKKEKSSAHLSVKEFDISRDVQQKVDDLIDGAEQVTRKVKKTKNDSYGITPGETPFSDFTMPTAAACKEVNDLLSVKHGKVEQPATIPPPSLEVTGCGEVPSVLDALVRTRLSAATTGTNSAYAFTGLVEKYGIMEEGIGKGSVNWNKVRDSKITDIERAIKRGGLAKTKSEDIKKILDLVYDQNIARRDAFIKEKQTGISCDIIGADRMPQGQKELEIASADQKILSLQYMHVLTADEAMTELTKFPGIGVKTASCVILFCLRRPSFAVDTHVYRLCNWLGWVPKGATRDQTFSHLEVRVPDELKYSLHQLFIRHGKTCNRCRAATGEMSEGWQATVCPIDHLVERTGKRKEIKK